MAAAGPGGQPAVHAARLLGHLHHGNYSCAVPALAWLLTCLVLVSQAPLHPCQLAMPRHGWDLCLTCMHKG